MADNLVPGGVAIIKDLDTTPRWKYEWNRLHDRIVAGRDPIHCRSPREMASLLAEAGLTVTRMERIDHVLTPYAHYLVRAQLQDRPTPVDPAKQGD